MLKQIKQFMAQQLALSEPERPAEEALQLASIALYLEMIEMDDRIEVKERALMSSLVRESFALSEEQAAALIAQAEQQRNQATDYFQFTSLINKQCSLEQKIAFIESLWQMAMVDGKIDPQEEYLVRKLADLLYVPHVEFIMAKNRASQS